MRETDEKAMGIDAEDEIGRTVRVGITNARERVWGEMGGPVEGFEGDTPTGSVRQARRKSHLVGSTEYDGQAKRNKIKAIKNMSKIYKSFTYKIKYR